MKHLPSRYALFLISCLITFMGQALKRVEINSQTPNLTDSLKQSNRFFIITEEVNLSGYITIGANSVLSFEGGFFSVTTKTNIKINLNNVEIASPPYQIFGDNIQLDGKIKNPIVPAEWFGQPGNDASKMINRALKFAGGNKIVSLDASEYWIKSPILLNQNGQRLWCTGTIKNQSDSAAIKVGATNLDVRIRSLEGYSDLGVNSFDSFRGSGILFGGNCFNSRFEIDRIYGFERGIDISPANLYNVTPYIPDDPALPKDTLYTSGVQYTEIKFKKITAKTGIYIDIYGELYKLPKPSNIKYSTWCNENQFNGGIITAKYGIDIVEKKGSHAPEYEINGNVFSNIDFENVTLLPIRMNNECHDYYRDINFKGSTIKCDTLIQVADSKFCGLNLKCELSGSKIKSGENCYGIFIDGFFYLDFFKDRVPYLDRMAIFSKNSWGKGPSTKYLTSSISGVGIVNSIDLPNATEDNPKDTVLTLIDLLQLYNIKNNLSEKDNAHNESEFFPDMPAVPTFNGPETRFLNQSCLINVGNNNKVVLDLQERGYVNYPIFVKLVISNGSSVTLKTGILSEFLTSGSYILTFKPNGEPEMRLL